MQTVLLVIQLLLAAALTGVVLVQKSEGGGLGMGSGTMGNLMSVRGTANLLTRVTAILAAAFMVTSLALGILAGNFNRPRSLIDDLPAQTAPAQPAPAQAPAAPAAPVAQ